MTKVTYTQVLHDGKNQSNCHTLKNKRKIVQWPPSYQDAKDMQGWLEVVIMSVPVPQGLCQYRSHSAGSGTSLSVPDSAPHQRLCTWVPIASLLCVWQRHHCARNTVPCTFPRAHLRLCMQVPSRHRRGAKVTEEPPAHWEETLHRKQKVHCVFCMSTPGVKRRLYTFPYSLCGINTKLIELCPAFTFASLHPLPRRSPYTEGIGHIAGTSLPRN